MDKKKMLLVALLASGMLAACISAGTFTERSYPQLAIRTAHTRPACNGKTVIGIVQWLQDKDGVRMFVRGRKISQGGYCELSLALMRTVAVIGGKLEGHKEGAQIAN